MIRDITVNISTGNKQRIKGVDKMAKKIWLLLTISCVLFAPLGVPLMLLALYIRYRNNNGN